MPTATPTERFEFIPLSRISESSTNPRTTYDEAKLQELADSIKSHGILQPILVRPKDDRVEIIAGSRRFRASGLAAVEHIPCRVVEMSDDQVLEVQIIENAQREDVHPIEEAMGYHALLKRGIYNVEQIAVKVGKSPATVQRRLLLAQLDERVAEYFQKIGAPVGAIELIAALTESDQKAICDRYDESWTIQSLKNEIRWKCENRLNGVKWNLTQINLVPTAGSCIGCAHNTASHGNLFESEHDKDSKCLKRECFEAKTEAWLQSEINRAVLEHGTVQRLSWSYGNTPEGMLDFSQFKPCTQDTRGAQPGIICEGHMNRLGELQWFTPRIDANGDAVTPASDVAAKRAERLAELRMFKVQCTYRRALFDRIMEFIDAESSDFAINILARPENLALMVAGIADSGLPTVTDSKDAARHPGKFAARQTINLPLGPSAKRFSAISTDLRSTIKALFLLATTTEISVSDYRKDTPMPVLDGCAKALSIDSAEILKAAEARFPVRKKKEVA